MSDFVRNTCTLPNRKAKVEALKKGDLNRANWASWGENACTLLENQFKLRTKKKFTESRKVRI